MRLAVTVLSAAALAAATPLSAKVFFAASVSLAFE